MVRSHRLAGLIGMLAMGPTVLFSLQELPWLGNAFEWQFESVYNYNYFSRVSHGQPVHNPSNNQSLQLDIGLCFFDTWEVAAEVEFANTPRQSWARRSVAVQVRKKWLDDLACDPISLSTGCVGRFVANTSLRDISSPYAARWNIEMHLATGKEWIRDCDWGTRIYGIGAIGQGNRGAYWIRAKTAWDWQMRTCYVGTYLFGYWGFGNKTRVVVNDFFGWGPIDHSSIDLGAHVHHRFPIWGSVAFEVAYRIYARSYPANVYSITLSYCLPFSL